MALVSGPERRGSYKDHEEQVNVVLMRRRVPAVAEEPGEHGQPLGLAAIATWQSG